MTFCRNKPAGGSRGESSARLLADHHEIRLATADADAPQLLEVLAADRGAVRSAIDDPSAFVIDRLHVGPTPTVVQLVNRHYNSAGQGHRRMTEALYVRQLVLDPGVTLDLAGMNLYYGRAWPSDPFHPDSGVTVIDSGGGGGIWSVSNHRTSP